MTHATRLCCLPLEVVSLPPGVLAALTQEGVPWVKHRPGEPRGRFVLCRRSQAGVHPAAEQTVLELDELLGATAAQTYAALADTGTMRGQWPLGELVVHEQVADDRARIARCRLLETLQEAVARHDGIWMRLAACPAPYRTAFNLRIDHDDFVEADFCEVHAALAGWEHAASHYVCAADFDGRPERLAPLRGMHVGGHGYWHHVYPSFDANLRNIRRGLEVLDDAGLAPSGFVAPHGRYSPALGRALAALQVDHSSEFAFAHDEWPIWPQDSSVLQIPVHPVCLGVCLEAAQANGPPESADHAVTALEVHFAEMVRSRVAAGRPIFVYGHPTGRLGRFPKVIRNLFAVVSEFDNIWSCSLAQFAHWWRQRSRIRWSAACADGRLTIEAANLPTEQRVVVEIVRGSRLARVELSGRQTTCNLAALPFETVPADSTAWPKRTCEMHSLRNRVQRWLDWEYATPIQELPARSPRDWLKRLLRTWHDARREATAC